MFECLPNISERSRDRNFESFNFLSLPWAREGQNVELDARARRPSHRRPERDREEGRDISAFRVLPVFLSCVRFFFRPLKETAVRRDIDPVAVPARARWKFPGSRKSQPCTQCADWQQHRKDRGDPLQKPTGTRIDCAEQF